MTSICKNVLNFNWKYYLGGKYSKCFYIVVNFYWAKFNLYENYFAMDNHKSGRLVWDKWSLNKLYILWKLPSDPNVFFFWLLLFEMGLNLIRTNKKPPFELNIHILICFRYLYRSKYQTALYFKICWILKTLKLTMHKTVIVFVFWILYLDKN